ARTDSCVRIPVEPRAKMGRPGPCSTSCLAMLWYFRSHPHRQPRPTGLRRKAARKLSRNAARDFLQRDTLRDHFQLTSRILEIDFTKNRFWQIDTVDTQSPMGRDLRRSLVDTRRQSTGIINRSHIY